MADAETQTSSRATNFTKLLDDGSLGTVGFIGLGNMGWWMCMNLRKKLPSTTVIYVCEIVREVCDKFVQEASGLQNGPVLRVGSAREIAEKSDIVFTMVPEGSHVREVFLNPEHGILSAERQNLPEILVDCSTIDTATSLTVAKQVSSLNKDNPHSPREVSFYDAPVSGGTPGAEKGTLTFMVGSTKEDPHAPFLRRILGMMGKNIFLCGGPSMGLVCKLSNNYLSGIIAIATSEAMNMGMRHGVDPKVLQQCFSKSSGGNWVNDTVNPVPGVCPDAVTSHGYQGGFKIQLMRKDFGLAVESARSVDAKLVLGDVALQAYVQASEDPRCRDRDSRVIYRWLGGKE